MAISQLGEYIREQRETAKISLRELAKSAGVSNPYLSQIERGLRISAEALYIQAGILDHREASPVVDAIIADEALTERQKQVLLEIHESFRKENAAAAVPAEAPADLKQTAVAAVDKAVTKAAPRTSKKPTTSSKEESA